MNEANTLADITGQHETPDQAATRLGCNAPRVKQADLDANIEHVEFVKHISRSGQVLRWAVLTTRSGFAVTGEPSAAVSPENDRAELGEKYALENAKRRLWVLMAYELKERLHVLERRGIIDDSRDAERATAEGMPVRAGGTD